VTAGRFDVAVVGGGLAGVAAALAAAEAGARTVLIERADRLGGNVSQAFVHTVCGLYLGADAGDARPANPGLAMRFARVLQAAGAAGEPERAGRVWELPTDPERVGAVAVRCCRAMPGIDLLLGHELVSASLARDGEGLQQLGTDTAQGGSAAFEAAIVVDTTGDAALATLGGADVEAADADSLQIASYIFRLGGVETTALTELRGFGRLRVTRAVAGAVREGELPAGCEAVLVRPSFTRGHVYVTLNLPRPVAGSFDPLSPSVAGALQAGARANAEKVVAWLRHTRPAFASCQVDAWPVRVGIRETRRVRGTGPGSGADVRAGRRRDDEVALSAWPIELWQDHRRARFEYPDGPCSVPLGALVSRSHPRLAMAGRCLGADHDALGALRVLGTALATGEAAGVAAALAAGSSGSLAKVAAESVRAHIFARADAPLGLA
jgi:hypothetical protein